jgi:hypothetical protein
MRELPSVLRLTTAVALLIATSARLWSLDDWGEIESASRQVRCVDAGPGVYCCNPSTDKDCDKFGYYYRPILCSGIEECECQPPATRADCTRCDQDQRSSNMNSKVCICFDETAVSTFPVLISLPTFGTLQC